MATKSKKTPSKKKTEKKPAKKAAPKKSKRKVVKVKGDDGPDFPKSIIPHSGKEKYADLRSIVLSAKGKIDSARWELSEALFKIKDEDMHRHWGYPDWETYVKSEVGINVRTSQYYMAMYQYFEIDFDKDKPLPKTEKKRIIDAVKKLGWTKGKCLIDVATGKNVWNWIKKAENLSGAELEAQAKAALNKKTKGKGGADTEVEVMKTISFRMSEAQIVPVDDALQLAGELLESDKKGHQLSMVCQDFIASTMAQKQKGQHKRTTYFNKLGAIFGCTLIAVEKESGDIVHGAKLFDKMRKSDK